MVPLATLIGRELRGGKSEKPAIRYGHAAFAKRGEDYFLVRPDCLRVPGDASSSFSVFAVFPIPLSVSVFSYILFFFCILLLDSSSWTDL